MLKIAINGFGRIGKNFLKSILTDKVASEKIDVVAINIGPADIKAAAHLFKYDTLYGIFSEKVEVVDNFLIVGNTKIKILTEIDPTKIDWSKLGIDWVVDCSGRFTNAEDAKKHIFAGAKHVLISAPAKGEDISIIPGINNNAFDNNKHKIVSLGSCTTNALIPILKVLNDAFGIEQGFMTTTHAYTNDQVVLDLEHKDLRRSRAAALNIIPTTTGASKMVKKIMPELGDVISGISIRVPTGVVSLVDLVFITKKEVTKESINHAFDEAAQGKLKEILSVEYAPLVSSDFKGNSLSVIIDAELTQAQNKMAKVFGWYDNEWGYSCRLRDFLLSLV